MGIYGIDFYGVGRFGRDPSVIRPDFSVDPFTTMPLDYSSLHLHWTKPASGDCVNLRLVRSYHNLSQDGGQSPGTTTNADAGADGLVLFTDVADRLPDFDDTLLASGFVYYTMWGWSNSTQSWVRCSDVIGLVPINWGYGYRLYSLLPMAYRDRDVVLVDPYNPWPVDDATPPLQRYLQLIGFQFDFIRTELESLMSINDPQNCSGAVLPLLAQQLAIMHEPEIGMQQERQLLTNAVHLYKIKGSPRGIMEFCSIMTSYTATSLVHHGYNVMLTQDDSAFTDAIGTWQVWPPRVPTDPYTWSANPSNYAGTWQNVFPPLGGQATGISLTWISNLMTVSGMTDPVGEIYGTGFPVSMNPPYNDTGMRVQATGAGDITITTGPIPITDFMSQFYAAGTATFRIQIWTASATPRQVYLSLWGDNGSGNPVQIIAPGTGTVERTGHWVQMTVSTPVGGLNPYPQSVTNDTAPTGPASYYWVYPRIRIAGAAANEAHYITLCSVWPCTPAQIGVDTGSNTYEYSRDVKVVMQPQYSNLLSNTLTTFARTNPNPPPPQLLIGFDGLCAAPDPMNPGAAAATGQMVYRQQTAEDAPGAIAVNGNAALQFNVSGPNGTIWFGKVINWSAAPPSPNGWFDATNSPAQWFPGAVPGSAAARPWMDPAGSDPNNPPNSWFVEPVPGSTPPFGDYFGIGQTLVNGLWFPSVRQPTANCNINPYTVQSGQPFNFSVYAEYTFVQDPTNAVMMLGFRWYYADDSWVEATTNVTLTQTYARYSIAPGNGPYNLGIPPIEQTTGQLPVQMFPFVRFPFAQQASFLLNSAMLAPAVTEPDYMDATSFSSATGDFLQDPNGASYYYARRTPRIARLTSELYRWLPMGSTYSILYTSGAIMAPLDPTLWQ